MQVGYTSQFVEDVLYQLKGYVSKGEPVQFHICYTACSGEPTVDFIAIQYFDEENQPQPQTEPAIR